MLRGALLVALSLLARAGALDAPADPRWPGDPPAVAPVKVGHAVIDGVIDELKARYFKRVVERAKAEGVTALVVHITTDGGTLDGGRQMLATAIAAGDTPMLVAYIDDRAISAGAMVAYGHRRIYMTRTASIGDIGVIMQGADGKIEYAPEKFETVVRGLLRQAGERNGWDPAKIQKMTARDQDLYRFDLANGPMFVIEDDLARFLADHPGFSKDDAVLVAGHDRLLFYTATEAVQDGMATALVDGIDDVYRALGADPAAVVDLSPTGVERMSWYLAGWAPLLLSLAILCVILEFKAPGIGIWTALAVVFGTLFFVCQYTQELAGNLELVLIVLGLLAIIVEFFFLPHAGLLAIAGFAAMILGIVLAFMPDDVQFHPSAEGFAAAAASALAHSALAVVTLTAGLMTLIWVLPRSPAMRRLAVGAEIAATSAGADEGAAATLVGRRGTARTPLRPSGFIELDGQELSAITAHGEHVAPGAVVEVVAMRFGEAVVRAAGATA